MRLDRWVVIFLLLVTGCAHSAIPPSPLPEAIQQQLGKMGVAVRPRAEEVALSTPGTGRLSNIGRGATVGTAMGAGGGAQGGYAAIFAIPVGAALGLVGGTVYGAVASEDWYKADTTFRTIVAELDLNRALSEHLAAFSRSHGYEISNLIKVAPQGPQEKSPYAAARRDGIDTVLEIQDFTVTLMPAEFMVNPQRGLILSAHVQLVRTSDEKVLDDRMVTDELGPALALNNWMANHAARFREEVVQASQRLAEAIVTEYFLAYHFPEQVIPEFSLEVHLSGLRAWHPQERKNFPANRQIDKDLQTQYPTVGFPGELSFPIPNEFRILAQRIDSLQPTFRWELFPGTNVTYELKIWRSGRLGPEAVVYNRANIEQDYHKIEVTLEPSTLYYWSVRAHFLENGRDRITDWSRRSVKHALAMKILTGGIVALAPDPVDEGFYVFITPQPASQGLQPAAPQSTWFPWGNWPLSPPDSKLEEQQTSDSNAPQPAATPSDQAVSCAWFQPEIFRKESDDLPLVHSLQPTLQWDRFPGPGEQVTYDVAVWRGGKGLREVQLGPIIYERQGLTELSHQIETALEPTTHYLWAVRAHFKLNDQIQMTDWIHEIDRGTSAQPRYCRFWTPSFLDLRKSADLPATRSQWFPWGNWPLSPPDSERQEQPTK